MGRSYKHAIFLKRLQKLACVRHLKIIHTIGVSAQDLANLRRMNPMWMNPMEKPHLLLRTVHQKDHILYKVVLFCVCRIVSELPITMKQH